MEITLPKNARSIIDALEAQGYEAYAVGGCVRDALLGIEPHDWDICTSALPEQVKDVATKAGFATFDTGIAHGTITVHADHEPFEVTTYRSDGAYTDGRHPDQVTFLTNIEGDLLRRDFTVNALAYHPVRGLVDVCGGASDLEAGVLRAVGEPHARFAEDGLRIIRALRFAATYGFEIEPATAAAIHEDRALLGRVAVERISTEFLRLLCGKGVVDILLAYPDVIEVFIPQVAPMVGLDQLTPYHCYDVYEHSARVVGGVRPDPVMRLAAFLHDVGKPECFFTDEGGRGHFYFHPKVGADLAERICRDLHLPKATCAAVWELVRYHDCRHSWMIHHMEEAILELGEERCRQLFELMHADLAAHSDYAKAVSLDQLAENERRFEETLARIPVLSLADLAVGGNDCLEVGLAGPAIGEALDELLLLVASGAIPNERAVLKAWLSDRTS